MNKDINNNVIGANLKIWVATWDTTRNATWIASSYSGRNEHRLICKSTWDDNWNIVDNFVDLFLYEL